MGLNSPMYTVLFRLSLLDKMLIVDRHIFHKNDAGLYAALECFAANCLARKFGKYCGTTVGSESAHDCSCADLS